MITTNHTNGNASVKITSDGSRYIDYEGEMNLDSPLNVDIRIMTKCSFGADKNGKAICSFCHESATVDGDECDYDKLYDKLSVLPVGTELAIGTNDITDDFIDFLYWCKDLFIVSLTVNGGHVKKHRSKLEKLLQDEVIAGLGISYRKDMMIHNINHSNVVWHVIAGIDSISDVKTLVDYDVKKILVLGEKDFGFNKGNVKLQSVKHKQWFWKVHELFDLFNTVSFDNLGLQQLKIDRFFKSEEWDVFNQGEYSMYINAVDGYFSPSSRNPSKVDWDEMCVNQYFNKNVNI